MRQLEEHSQRQEAELIKLINAKDGGGAGAAEALASKEEELGELQDNLYEVSQKLEEEQARGQSAHANVVWIYC